MSATYDVVIRGGTIIDGTGGPAYEGDIGILDGRIARIGKCDTEGAARVIDAEGCIVTPGFVDIHTHYDAQAIWSDRLVPSSYHGVTTAVMSNCGVGFAPVRPSDHDRLVELMEGVEDIPGVALKDGLDWRWESLPEFLDALERRPHDMDIAMQVPHAPLRLYVMGDRAQRLEAATDEDIRLMTELAVEAVQAGALGFSTSRSINHRSAKGDPMPSLRAAENELQGIADGLSGIGRGVLQLIMDFDDAETLEDEFAMVRRIAERSGRPLSYSLMQKRGNPEGWKRLLELTRQAVLDGVGIKAQIAPRGVGVMLGLQGSRIPFTHCPTYRHIAALSVAERLEAMHAPETRRRILAESRQDNPGKLSRELVDFENMFVLGDPPNYNPTYERSVATLARRAGKDPAEWAYDYLLSDDGLHFLCIPFANYQDASLDACRDMLIHPDTILGLGDGGAHVGLISDVSFQTFMLSYWSRMGDSPALGLPSLVRKQTSDTARAVGLHDRGTLLPGQKADINIIELSRLEVLGARIERDLPGGQHRLMQKAAGYRATLVSGVVTYEDGHFTGALPGRLIRGQRQAPLAA
jgi:N-acyl-D-aspartate/D-glutamate deacylase